MSAEQAPEPTMDEILASIRRIISDEPTEQVGDVQGNLGTNQLSQSGENAGIAGGNSVADDIARALSGGPKEAEGQADQTAQPDEDIFQLTNDQVAVTEDQSSNPVHEMEKALQEQGAELKSGITEPSFDEVREEVGVSEFQSVEEDRSKSALPLQHSPDKPDSPNIELTQGLDEMVESVMSEPQSQLSDSHEVQLEIGGENPGAVEADKQNTGHEIADFDQELAADIPASSEELLTESQSPTEIGESPILDSAEPVAPDIDNPEIGLELSDVDNLFSGEAGVSSTDISEANEILSGSAEANEDLGNSSSIGENLLFSGDQDVEPPALASAVVSDAGQPEPGLGIDSSLESLDEKSGDQEIESQPIKSELSTEPLPELEIGEGVTATDSDLLSPMPEPIEQQIKSEFSEMAESATPIVEEPPELQNEVQVDKGVDQPQASINTFEQGIKDMLRPMIQNWLDANLPRLVEGAIKEEISSRRDDGPQSGED